MAQYVYKVCSVFEISDVWSKDAEVYVETRRQAGYTFAEACGVASALSLNLYNYGGHNWTSAYVYKQDSGRGQYANPVYAVVRFKNTARKYED